MKRRMTILISLVIVGLIICCLIFNIDLANDFITKQEVVSSIVSDYDLYNCNDPIYYPNPSLGFQIIIVFSVIILLAIADIHILKRINSTKQ